MKGDAKFDADSINESDFCLRAGGMWFFPAEWFGHAGLRSKQHSSWCRFRHRCDELPGADAESTGLAAMGLLLQKILMECLYNNLLAF